MGVKGGKDHVSHKLNLVFRVSHAKNRIFTSNGQTFGYFTEVRTAS